jgi:uncharacterized protein (UPF0210 family)
MKIRTVTLGLELSFEDFQTGSLNVKLEKVDKISKDIAATLISNGYVVQTTRLVLNPLEDWLIPIIDAGVLSLSQIIELLIVEFEKLSFMMFNVGCCSTVRCMELLPQILAASERFSGSVNFQKSEYAAFAPPFDLCKAAASVSIKLAELCGDLANFRFCCSFNCAPFIPFFPAAYHKDSSISVSIGLENGDLMFIAFNSADSYDEAHDNLFSSLQQIIFSIQAIVQPLCSSKGVSYKGVDSSINPGLLLFESVVGGMESVINCGSGRSTKFGEFGTLAAVSVTTRALKSLDRQPFRGMELKTTGYNGVMLPVMEDIVLAERAAQDPSLVSLRDLLMFSAVCGVGLDTVPVPGDITVDQVAGVYTEVAALAFRLDKPLTCRLLPMRGKKAGDFTDIESPYMVNTKVFSV